MNSSRTARALRRASRRSVAITATLAALAAIAAMTVTLTAPAEAATAARTVSISTAANRTATDTAAAKPAGPATAVRKDQEAFLTFYGWWDNTPPGGDIAYPELHDTAGGEGTYEDPITFASSTDEIAAGERIWVPRVGKYFIMEDDCQECGEDWNDDGPNGGPGLYHFDLWLGGEGGSAFDAIDCEDALTHYNEDTTPVLETVVLDPPDDKPYDPTPIFDTETGKCYGGAQPHQTVGQYKNLSTGTCLDSPGKGARLAVAACSGDEKQRFTFRGAFMMSDGQCATMSGSSIELDSCDGGPKQQWSVNPDLTISDIQTGKKCFRASGGKLTAGSCSGAASQWNFTASGGTAGKRTTTDG